MNLRTMPRRSVSILGRVLVAAAMFTTVLIVGSMVAYGIIHYWAKLRGVNI